MATLLYDQHGNALKEDSGWAWPALLDEATFDDEFSEPYARGNTQKLGYASYDRIGLREWTQQERRDYLARAHQLVERNPMAKAGIRLISSFAIGEGMSVVAHGEGVQDMLDAFLFTPYIQKNERDWFSQWLVDGELFLYMAEGKGRRRLYELQPIAIKPWRVLWIETDPENYSRRVSYHVEQERWDGKYGAGPIVQGALDIPAEEIIHVTLNSFAYEMRGRSDLFAIFPWLTAYQRWLEDRVRINRFKGFIYQLQMTGATPSQVSSKQTQLRKPPVPGSLYVSSDREKLIELGGSVEAGRVAEDGRQIKLMGAVGLNLPEYALSDGYAANLATAKAQQLPLLRILADFQDTYIRECWRPILQRLIDGHLGLDAMVRELNDAGEPTGKMVLAREAFSVSYPDLEDRDPQALAQALQIAVAQGWVSMRTASGRMGFNYAQERMYIRQEQEEEATAAVQGRSIRGQPVPDEEENNGQGRPNARGDATSKREEEQGNDTHR